MGDGHHGWAAAEIVLALRDAFVYEQWKSDGHELRLLGGIPAAWYESGRSFSIAGTAIPEGTLGLAVSAAEAGAEVEIAVEAHPAGQRGPWMLIFPHAIAAVRGTAAEYSWSQLASGEYAVRLDPVSDRLQIVWERATS